MKAVKLCVGSVKEVGGRIIDAQRVVEFVGEELGSYATLTGNDDTRGVDETLYRSEDGRLIVHVKDWSNWQGEPTVKSLYEVTEADLRPNGRFEFLGAECGFGRPLTLDEALSDIEA